MIQGLAVNDGLVFSGAGTQLTALNANNGEVKWKVTTASKIRSIPAVSNGTIYMRRDDGVICAVDSDNGNELWNFNATAFEGGGPDASLTSLAFADGVLYIGRNDGLIFALDCQSREGIWKYRAAGPVHSTPAFYQGVLYIGSKGDYLYALNISDGKMRWKSECRDWYQTPVIYNKGVIMGTEAFLCKNGKKVWDASSTVKKMYPPACFLDTFYSQNAYSVFALNPGNKKLVWKYRANRGNHSPVVSGSVVYFGDGYAGNRYYAVDAKTGEELGSFRVSSGANKSPVIAGGMAYLISSNMLFAVH